MTTLTPTPLQLTPEQRKDFIHMRRTAEKLPTNFLLCRCVGHAWTPITPDREPLFGRLFVWECMRCTTKRDDIFDTRWGNLLARSYRYVEGYKVPRPSGRRGASTKITRDALRVAVSHRDIV